MRPPTRAQSGRAEAAGSLPSAPLRYGTITRVEDKAQSSKIGARPLVAVTCLATNHTVGTSGSRYRTGEAAPLGRNLSGTRFPTYRLETAGSAGSPTNPHRPGVSSGRFPAGKFFRVASCHSVGLKAPTTNPWTCASTKGYCLALSTCIFHAHRTAS